MPLVGIAPKNKGLEMLADLIAFSLGLKTNVTLIT